MLLLNKKQMRFIMSTILLLVIYIAFIGLGIPDSLFGTAWPAIYKEFDVSLSSASYITMLISGGTVVSSLFSSKIINKIGTGNTAAISTLITAFSLLGFSYSKNMIWLCLFALPLGLGAGAIDTALNNYVALNYKVSHMNFLHCFYGIGVSASPYIMSLLLRKDANWRDGYYTIFYIQMFITIIVVSSLPLWKKTEKIKKKTDNSKNESTINLLSFFKLKAVRYACAIFIGSCAIEYTCGIWGSTFLVNSKDISIATAAKIITLYYVGIALGRLLSGIVSNLLSSWNLIKIGQFIIFIGIFLLILPLPFSLSGLGLFLIGIGNGPIFPNLLHLTPENFGEVNSQQVMGIQMAASYVGIMLMPPVFGILGQNIGTYLFPYYLLALFSIMSLATFILIKVKNNQNKIL